MKPLAAHFSTTLASIPSLVYLWTAVLIFAASTAVTRKITQIGAEHLVNGHNPISLCNVLFVGNLCALATLTVVFGKQWNRRNVRSLHRSDWISLGLIGVLAGALAPALIFAALETTNVTSVVLIGRLEAPLTLAFSVCFLRSRVNLWTVSGSVVSFLGVAVTAILNRQGPMVTMMGGLQMGRGELMTAIAALMLAIATIISKRQLQNIPLGIFNLVRTAVGTIIFFFLARTLYGSQHFAEVFSPFLWQWMLLYGAVIVVAGQLCWFAGLRGSTTAESTLANSLNPIAAVAMAYIILGEVPSMAQYVGGGVILVGIGLSFVGTLRDLRDRATRSMTPDRQMTSMIGFKGI